MGKKGKNKKPKKKAFLDEVETVTYEQQIAEDNKQLARLRARNEELETEAEKLAEKLASLEENKADLTSHLQSVLDKKIQESEELQERLKALEKRRQSEEAAARRKEVKMENEFKLMENNLTAELKLAAGKLSALEDFRQARLELMKKFEEQEKQMAEQEVRHKETLYETKKQLIINKTNMQNELERRLQELSESFRAATELRLADATQRVVRENLALQRELSNLLDFCRRMYDLMEESKEKERSLRLQTQLYDAEAKLALEKLTKQTEMIEKLAVDQKEMCKAIGRSQRAEQYAERCERLLEEARKSNSETRQKIRILEQQIERSREDVTDSVARTQDNFTELERLTRILFDAKQCIQDALMLQNEIENQEDYEACSTCCLDVKERLLHTLFNIFSAYESADRPQDLDEESEHPDDMYKFGNLGLIPTTQDDASTISKSETDPSIRSILRAFCDDKVSMISEPSTNKLSQCTCSDEQGPSKLSSRF